MPPLPTLQRSWQCSRGALALWSQPAHGAPVPQALPVNGRRPRCRHPAAPAAEQAGRRGHVPRASAQQWQQSQQQQSEQQQQSQQQQAEQLSQPYAGRLLLRQGQQFGAASVTHDPVPSSLSEVWGALPRGVTAPHPAAGSARDTNMRFSSRLKHVASVAELLELLAQSDWGPALCHLDGVSLVGALLWLSRSSEWAALCRRGAVHADWQLRQQGQAAIEALLDCAEALVLSPQPSSSGGPAASPPAAASSPPPPAAAAGAAAAGAAGAAAPWAPLVAPAQLADLVYLASKLQQQRPQLLAAAAAGLAQDLYACSPTELFRLIWGLASARVHPGDPWLLNWCKAAQARFFHTSPLQLAIFAYSLARLGYRPPDPWVAAWLEAAAPALPGFNAQNLANAAWGLASWRFQAPRDWLAAFYAAAAGQLPAMSPVGISQLCLALVTLGGGEPPPPAWVARLLAAARPLLGRMELLQLCNLGWALANWRAAPEEAVMQEYLAASEPLLVAATPTDLSTLLWVCDKLCFVPRQSWLEAWFGAAYASLPRFEPTHLATTALVLGGWGVVPVPGFSVEFWRASKARFPEASPYHLSLLAWGLARARRAVPPSWASALVAAFAARLASRAHEALPEDGVRLLGGLAGVAVKPCGSHAWLGGPAGAAARAQLEGVAAWLAPRLGELQPGWLAVLARALAVLELRVGAQAVARLQAAAAQADERLTPQQRRALLQHLAALKQQARSRAGAGGGDSGGGGSDSRTSDAGAGETAGEAQAGEWAPQPWQSY